MDREALAWAAGLFDGEGCFHFSMRRRSDGALDRSTQTRINQIDPEVLHRFRDAVGGLGNVYGPYAQKATRRRPLYQYVAYGYQQAQAITAFLWPWLGTVKRSQALNALRGNRRNPPTGRGRPPKRRQLASIAHKNDYVK